MMAPASLAPGDRAEGDGGDAAEPPGRTAAGARPCATPAHHTDNHPAASPQLAPHARPRLEARRSAGAPLRTATPCPPGSSFQDRLLRDFYTTAVPGAIAPNPSASLWVTPATKDPRYNLAFVTNMLNYMLTVSPGRLCVVRVRSRVFRFTVSCQNIANVLAIRGTALLPCSSQLKKAVGKKSLLTRSKLPIAPADLRRMVAAAGIGKKPTVPEQTA